MPALIYTGLSYIPLLIYKGVCQGREIKSKSEPERPALYLAELRGTVPDALNRTTIIPFVIMAVNCPPTRFMDQLHNRYQPVTLATSRHEALRCPVTRSFPGPSPTYQIAMGGRENRSQSRLGASEPVPASAGDRGHGNALFTQPVHRGPCLSSGPKRERKTAGALEH